jgi:hypothetical protein
VGAARQKSRAQRRVARAKPLRHQHLNRLVDQFVAWIPENALSLGVDHNDLAHRIAQHHRIWGCLYDDSKALFGGDLGRRLRTMLMAVLDRTSLLRVFARRGNVRRVRPSFATVPAVHALEA